MRVDTLVDVTPGAQGSALAASLAAHIRDNLAAHESKRKALRAMRGVVCLVADDTGEALTMRFDYGRLAFHGGVVGVPDVTIRAQARVLGRLPDLPSPSLAGVQRFIRGGRSRRALTLAAQAAGTGQLKVYGAALNALLVTRFWRVLSKTV